MDKKELKSIIKVLLKDMLTESVGNLNKDDIIIIDKYTERIIDEVT